jgi:hypothetical protein
MDATDAMIGRQEVSILRPCSSVTAPIVRASDLEPTLQAPLACCKPMPMPASINSMARRSRRWLAGHIVPSRVLCGVMSADHALTCFAAISLGIISQTPIDSWSLYAQA